MVREQRCFPGQGDSCSAKLLFFLKVLNELVNVNCTVYVHLDCLLQNDGSIIQEEGKKCVRYIAVFADYLPSLLLEEGMLQKGVQGCLLGILP